MLEAIDHLLEVDIPEAPYAVARRTRTWAFADPVLEGMSDAQRHLLRMGPRNATKIQGSLRRLREALESAAAVSATTSGPSDRPAAASTAVYQDGLEASRSSTP